MLTRSFEDLAQALRILLEANLQLRRLLSIDRGEAIGTLENAINAKLDAFHNLYDLMQQRGLTQPNWYDVPELCTVLAIRNARHHNMANRIRSLFNYHRYESKNPTKPARYLYVDFPAPPEEKGGDCFDIPLSWFDLDTFLSLPRSESRLRPPSVTAVREYLNAEAIDRCAKVKRVSKERTFFNLVPLTLNAGIALLPHVKPHVSPDSVEATHFLWHFEHVCPAETKTHECAAIKFGLPK